MRQRITLAIGMIAFGFMLAWIIGEAAFRIIPNHYVSLVRPGTRTGAWHLAGMEYEWTGMALHVKHPPNRFRWNSLGMHDVDHSPVKPFGTLRVLLLGDSFIEAVQLPLEQTL